MEHAIGLAGISLILGMYFLLQIDILKSTDILYSIGNGFGSIFLLISLYHDWNLPAAILQIAWIGISVYGIIKSLRLKKDLVISNA